MLWNPSTLLPAPISLLGVLLGSQKDTAKLSPVAYYTVTVRHEKHDTFPRAKSKQKNNNKLIPV